MTQQELEIYFRFSHLPEKLQEISKPFCEIAKEMGEKLNDCPQKDIALQKLLEAKDAAVRSGLKS